MTLLVQLFYSFYQQGLNTDEVMEMTEVNISFAKGAGIDVEAAIN